MLKPALILGVFGLFFAALYKFGFFQYFKWSVWKEIHLDIKSIVLHNPIKSFLIAIIFYLVAILTFLPGMLLFDLIVGYMFPQMMAVLVICTGATIGALTIVSGYRFGFKKLFTKEQDNKLLGRIKEGFAQNETLYLLFLRFVPFFPFAFVSVAVASLPVSYKKVAWTTFVGMLPIAIILSTVAKSLDSLLKLHHMPSFSEMVSPTMTLALVSLCLLSLLPIAAKRFLKKKED